MNKAKQIYVFIFNYEYRINKIINLIIKNKEKSLFFKLLRRKLIKKNIIIGKYCAVGDGLRLPHPQNIVIGKSVKIGKNCTIYHEVTLGQNKGKYPKIGDNVIIYAGAKIVGDIEIGDNVIIGANSLVINDVPSNMIVGGVPAKFIKYRRYEDEFN